MAKLSIKKATTDVTVYLFVQDSSKTTGEGLTGLTYNTASLVASYVRPLGSRTAITLATLAAVDSAHADGGFKEIDATNMPGVYRLDLPDAVCATGVNSAIVMLKGAANMAPVLLEMQLTSYDPNDAVRLGMTALPNAAADAAGGLPISDAGGLDIDAQLGTKVSAIESRLTSARAGYLDKLNVSGALAHSDAAATYKADVSGLATSAALATVAGYIDTEVAAILAAVDTEVAAIKAKTDNLPASPAAVGSAMTLASNSITAAVIATDAIDADAIKADAVTEIQSGLATASALATVAGYVDDLEGRLTATRAGYLDKLNVSGTLAHSDAAATYKADVSGIPAAVWGHATRTLSSFGTLVSDIWSAATRTLSAFAFTVTGAKDASIDAIKAKTDGLPASPAAVGSAMTLTSGERTAIANEVEAQIIDDTDAEKVLKAITDKIASVNPSLDDLTLAGIASAVRTELTTELARIDAAISSRLATAGYTAPANNVINNIYAKTQNLPNSPAATNEYSERLYALSVDTGDLLSEALKITNKTDNLPASPAASGEYTSALSAIQADLDNPNQYKADVSGLATSAHLQEVEDKVDGLSGLGIGSEVWQYTLLDNNGVPIADAYIEVTSDDAGIIKLDRGITNAGGVATFHLDPGTVYVWRYKYGYAGDNPDIETVP